MSDVLTPEQRTMRARLAAHAMHAKYDGRYITSAARRRGPGSLEYWLDKVDPDRELSERDRVKRAQSAKSAYYTKLAYKASRARSAKRAAAQAGGGDDRT